MDVPSLMRQAAFYNRHRRALMFEGRCYTFSEAWERGVRLANALINLGIKPGDRVAAVEDNSIAAADFFVGAAIAGAVRVPLYARNSRDSHKAMLRSTEARVLFADAPYASSVLELERELEVLQKIIIRADDYEAWLAQQSTNDPLISVRDDDWYVIRHSSGTSGRPKGVGYTQHGWVANSRNWVYRLPRLDGDSVVAHVAPISHASGYLFLPAWLAGAANLMFRSFDVPNVLDVIENAPVTHAFLAPSMIAALSADKSVANRRFPQLVCILCGGAPITDATIAAARRAFGDILHQVYGLTEAVPMTVMTPQEWFAEIEGSKPLRSAGRVMPFALLEIRDAEGKSVPIGEVGEIWCRCEGQMQGYWRDEELSRNRISDGWIRSGDIGRLDASGYVYLMDRADDMIVSGGFNIWPAELETVIADHPKVIEVAVFGIPHDKWGETPMAVCRVDRIEEVTQEEIADLVATRMGSYMKPTRVEFTTDPLPKTVVGKLSRRTLRDPHWQGRDRRVGGA
jgi:acyl-CoA synthetase (AMP-forming)/AMP-acid ligase II